MEYTHRESCQKPRLVEINGDLLGGSLQGCLPFLHVLRAESMTNFVLDYFLRFLYSSEPCKIE